MHNLVKSATVFYDLYIENCDPLLAPEALRDYILNETNIEVKHCEELQTKRRFSKSKERDALLLPDVWPGGLICRNFFKPFYKW